MYIKKSGFIKALFISTIHKILFEKKNNPSDKNVHGIIQVS